MICAVSILSKMAAECLRQATAFKISYHMVKITSQVQKSANKKWLYLA